MRGSAPLLAIAVAAIGCAPPASPPRCAYEAAPPIKAEAHASTYRYHAVLAPDAEQICVSVDVPSSAPVTPVWSARADVAKFFRDVAFARGNEPFSNADEAPGGYRSPCRQGEACRARYRVLLREMARAFDDSDAARFTGGTTIAPPSVWMIRPQGLSPAYGLAPKPPVAPFRLSVAVPSGLEALGGLFVAPDDKAIAVGDLASLVTAPYWAVGPLDRSHIDVPGAAIEVALTRGRAEPAARMLAWIDRSTRAIASYFGAFPIKRAAIVVLRTRGSGIGGGRTMGNGGASIVLNVGDDTSERDLSDDWILVHELVHVSFPNVLVAWAEEGLATYVEPIVRVRAGLVTADELWRSMVEGLPQGLPEPGDAGLDNTDTWGRTYWGGALFWFLADIRIREKTNNQKSLDDALRAIVHEGGNVAVTWSLDEALGVGDRATGTNVLVALRREMGQKPVSVDLPVLWERLGVSVRGTAVSYDDTAPLAAVRRGIITGKVSALK